MEKAAPYAVNWQVNQSPIGADSDGKLDLGRLLKIVRHSGYSGYLPVETLSARGRRTTRCRWCRHSCSN
jgi:hypothetical protein